VRLDVTPTTNILQLSNSYFVNCSAANGGGGICIFTSEYSHVHLSFISCGMGYQGIGSYPGVNKVQTMHHIIRKALIIFKLGLYSITRPRRICIQRSRNRPRLEWDLRRRIFNAEYYELLLQYAIECDGRRCTIAFIPLRSTWCHCCPKCSYYSLCKKFSAWWW
jgi:hypothetical protein